MKRILIIDTAYPDFLMSLPFLSADYNAELAKYMSYGFGTFDAYSHYLKAAGWETVDVIANHNLLQRLWAVENGYPQTTDLKEILRAQVEQFQPDVIFLQDIGHIPLEQLRQWKRLGYFIAAQCSCALSPNVDVRLIDVIFTSLPAHVDSFNVVGGCAVYLPLAFDPRMKPEETARDIDISFVGGVGRHSHWSAGTDALEIVAAHFGERFEWYGYGLNNLQADSDLRDCYRGTAWGREMYSIYGRSKVVVNRHGEIANGFTNNLRCFEAAGCGALLVTESSKNLYELFPKKGVVEYSNGRQLCDVVEMALFEETFRAEIAKKGSDHVLANHTYANRMKMVSSVLYELMAVSIK